MSITDWSSEFQWVVVTLVSWRTVSLRMWPLWSCLHSRHRLPCLSCNTVTYVSACFGLFQVFLTTCVRLSSFPQMLMFQVLQSIIKICQLCLFVQAQIFRSDLTRYLVTVDGLCETIVQILLNQYNTVSFCPHYYLLLLLGNILIIVRTWPREKLKTLQFKCQTTRWCFCFQLHMLRLQSHVKFNELFCSLLSTRNIGHWLHYVSEKSLFLFGRSFIDQLIHVKWFTWHAYTLMWFIQRLRRKVLVSHGSEHHCSVNKVLKFNANFAFFLKIMLMGLCFALKTT